MGKRCPRCNSRFDYPIDTAIQTNQVGTPTRTAHKDWATHCNIPLSEEQLDYITRNYNDLLCPHCMQSIAAEEHPVSVRELSNFLLDLSRTLMGAGAHTSRVVRNVTRIAESFGYKVDMTIFQMHITMTIRHAKDDTVRRTSVGKIGAAAFNFNTISQISTLSWEAHDDYLSFRELLERYKQIIHEPRLSRWWVLGLVTAANACFCRLFGGDVYAMGIVAVATLIGFFIRQEMSARHINHMAIFLVCSFIASLIAATGFWFHLGSTPETALGTSVLFLIPGVPLINSIFDLLEGHVLVGISRAVNALILIVCIALGLSATMLILGLDML